MGFYLKKTIKCGLLRFNLSNSGIGVSTGVKGLRAGIDGKGRTYIGGGKGILRYRKQLGTFGTLKNRENANDSSIWKMISIVLFLALILTAAYLLAPDTVKNLFVSLF